MAECGLGLGNSGYILKPNHYLIYNSPFSSSPILFSLEQLFTYMFEMNVLSVVERNIKAWNASDVEARLNTLHFPQYRIDEKGVFSAMSREQVGAGFKRMFGFVKEHERWDHSVIDSMEVIHESKDKVHLSCEFSRFRADGTRYASLKSYWVMVKIEGEWKRSSVSNMPLEYYLPENELEILEEQKKRLLTRA